MSHKYVHISLKLGPRPHQKVGDKSYTLAVLYFDGLPE